MFAKPNKFAEWFNKTVPGAYRQITAQDIHDMTESGLVGKYGGYFRSDLETVRGLLQYEQLFVKRSKKGKEQTLNYVPRCKGCGKPLPVHPPGRKGRPKEFCSACEPSRSRERYRRYSRKRQLIQGNSVREVSSVRGCLDYYI